MKVNISKITVIAFIFSLLSCFAVQAEPGKVEMFIFYSPTCKACFKLKDEFIPKIMEEYKDRINLKSLNIKNPANLSFLVALSERYGKKEAAVPAMLIGNDFLTGVEEIKQGLTVSVKKYSKSGFSLSAILSSGNLLDVFKSISVSTIISAGLIDGINPCAFAVIVFLISFLGVYGYQKQETVYVGFFYVLSIFVTHVLIGLGLFNFFYSMKNFYFLTKMFYYLVAAICFLLCGLSLYDYVKFKKTKETGGMLLQLPMFLKKRINLVIGAGLRKKSHGRIIELCFISFLIGFAVSILEAACTGQVYLPTIVFILGVPQLRVRAFAYLLLYNFMFVLPLIVIFVLSLIGVSSKELSRFLKKNIGGIKVIMVLLFFVLGIFMLLMN